MKYLFLLGCSFAVAAPALAQEGDIVVADLRVRPELITVVASGSGDQVTQVGQSVSVVTADEIASVQGPDLTRVLERLPGVTLTRNGGVGSFTGVRVRGADAEQLLVLIDGVRVNDMSQPGGSYDFGNLLSGGVSRIDLLRGSNSVVWGSQAIGGVLAITSDQRRGLSVDAEYGAHDSFTGNARAGLNGDWGWISLNGGYARTDGVSAAAIGTEPDGYRQWRIGGNGSLGLTDGLSFVAAARYADSRTDMDGFPPPTYFVFDDTPEFQKTREFSGRAGLEWSSDALTLKARADLSDTRRDYYDPTFGTAPGYGYAGRNVRAELSGRWTLPSDLTLDFGADTAWSRFRSTFDPQSSARLSSGHALLGYHGEGLDISGGLRLDDHSTFGSHWTFGANGSVALSEGWRLRASYGEGFKAPTLFQLLSNYGNAALRPETSRSFDAGIETGDRNGQMHFAVSVFRRDSRDLIDYVSCFNKTTGICTGRPNGTYDNFARARASGLEVEGDAKATSMLTLRAAYSYVKAVNLGTNKDLARRPRHALTLSADWETPLAGLKLGADLRAVSKSYDDAGNFTLLKAHTLAALRASLPLGDNVEVYGRVENVGDVRYESAAGFGTAGRSAFVGARAKF